MSTTRMLASRLRVVAIALVISLAGGVIALVPVAPAHAIGAANVTLTVTTKAGAPVTGLTISALPITDLAVDSTKFTGSGQDLGSGRYRFTLLDHNQDYTFKFGASGVSFTQYLGGSLTLAGAEIVSWSTSGEYSMVATLSTNSGITGKVTNASGGAIGSASVTAYRFDGSSWVVQKTAVTSSGGTFAITAIPPGQYRVGFVGPAAASYQTEYSGNATTFASAFAFTVPTGLTVVSNASLAAAGGALTGIAQVSDYPPGGLFSPANGVTARVYRLTEPVTLGAPEIDWSAPPYTSSRSTYSTSGRWSIGGLPAGRYIVKLWDESAEYDSRWVGTGSAGATEMTAAQVFTVTSGRTVTVPTTRLPWIRSLEPIDLYVIPQTSPGIPNYFGQLAIVSQDQPGVGYTSFGDTRYANRGTIYTISSGYWLQEKHPDFGDYTVVFYKPGYDSFVQTFSLSSYGSTTWSLLLNPRPTPFGFDSGPSVSGGTLDVGQEFTVDAHTTIEGGPTHRDVLYRYQWLRDGNEIHGATGTSYTARDGDIGTELSVLVSANEELLVTYLNGGPTISQLVTVGVIAPGPAPTNDTAPWISSPTTPKPGVTLTANSGVWSTTGLKFDYQWYSDGAPIAGATSRTFTLTALEATHDITVELVATKPGHPASDVVVSDPVPVENLAAPTQTKPSVVTKSTTGLPAGQVRYTVTPGTWNVPGLTFSYLWSVDGAGVGVFANSYVVDTATQGGSVIQVKVYAERQGYADTNQTVMVQKGAAPTGTLDVTDETTSSPVDALSQTELGHVLRATPSITYPTAGGGTVTTTYTWQRSTTGTGGWTTITGAKQPTYTPGLADLNRFLRVLTTTSSTLYLPVVQAASAGKAVPRTELSTGIPPTVGIAGSSSVSTTHRATVTGAWPIVGVALSYRWLTCAADCAAPGSFTAVAKATTSSWLPPAALAGREAVVEVTASKPGYAPLTVRSAAIVLDPLTAVTAFTPPTITGGLIAGDGAVGRPLTVKPGTFDVTVTRSYQWQYCDSSLGACVVDDDFITVGTNSTSYVPTAIGVIRVRETAARTGLTSVVQFSAPIDVEPGTLVAKVAPTVTKSGDTYTVNPGTTVPGTTAVAYQWYLDGDPVGAGGASHTDATVGASLHVVVTLTRDGYSPRTVTLVPRKGTAPTATGTITGSAYGETFIAPNDFTYPTTATPAPVTTYQWYSNGKAIPKATAATFTPSTAYLGKTITVRVSSSSPFYLPRTHTTTGVVVQKADAPTGSPTIVSSIGAIKPGAKLSVALDPGSWSTTGLTFSYLWQSSPNGVTWANLSTASTYTLLPTQPGVQVRVLVTARKTGYTDAVVPLDAGTVGWLGPIVNASEPTLGGPLLSGAASPVGSTLTAGPGLWNVAGLTYVYEWFRDGIIVPGATAATLTPTAEYYGDQLQVRVTAKAPGYQPVTAFSNIVVVGQGTAPSATTAPKITRSGNLLTATPGLWNVDGLVFSFQWLLDGSPIVGATSSTHTIAATGIYGVVVTATRDGYAPGSRTIAMTAAISPI